MDEKVMTDKLTRCVFCLATAVFKPDGLVNFKLLSCCHVICSKCADAWSETLDEPSRKCPECHEDINREFEDHRMLGDLASSDETTLGLCDHPAHGRRPLEYWCMNCEHFVCDNCIAAHKELKSTINHIIKDKKDVPFSKPPILCNNHPKESITLYCSACKVFTCRDCQLLDHRGHDYTQASTILNKTKLKLGEVYNSLRQKLQLVMEKRGRVQKRKDSLENIKNTRREECFQIEKMLKEAVDKTMKELRKKVDSDCSALKDELDRQLRDYEVRIAPSHQAVAFLWALISKGSPEDVHYYWRYVEKLKKNLSEIPEEVEVSTAQCILDGIDVCNVELKLKQDVEQTLKMKTTWETSAANKIVERERRRKAGLDKKSDSNSNKDKRNKKASTTNKKKEEETNKTNNNNSNNNNDDDINNNNKQDNKKKENSDKMKETNNKKTDEEKKHKKEDTKEEARRANKKKTQKNSKGDNKQEETDKKKKDGHRKTEDPKKPYEEAKDKENDGPVEEPHEIACPLQSECPKPTDNMEAQNSNNDKTAQAKENTKLDCSKSSVRGAKSVVEVEKRVSTSSEKLTPNFAGVTISRVPLTNTTALANGITTNTTAVTNGISTNTSTAQLQKRNDQSPFQLRNGIIRKSNVKIRPIPPPSLSNGGPAASIPGLPHLLVSPCPTPVAKYKSSKNSGDNNNNTKYNPPLKRPSPKRIEELAPLPRKIPAIRPHDNWDIRLAGH